MAEKSNQKSRPGNKRNQQPPAWIWLAVAVGAIAIVAAAALLSRSAAPTAGSENGAAASERMPLEISVAQAAEKREQGAFILDVREPDEWAAGHIPDATLIPLAELPNRLSEVPQDQAVVVVCRSGNRSATGRDILLQAGYSQVSSMAGGMNQWQAQGLPTIDGE